MVEKEITLTIIPLDLFLIRKALEEFSPSDEERQRRTDLLTWMHTDWDKQVEKRKKMTKEELIMKIRENAQGCKAPCARDIVQWTYELEELVKNDV